MIYVLLYKEMEMALTIQSIYSKTALLKLHPKNIKVCTLWLMVNDLMVLTKSPSWAWLFEAELSLILG